MGTQTYSGDERRNQRPAKSAARIICQRGELFLGPNIAESLVDASEEEVGILAREALSAGERVSLTLEGIAPVTMIQRVGRVSRCAPAEGGLFSAGVQLDSALDYAELVSLTTV